MDTRLSMWIHGVSALPQRTAGVLGADGPLLQVSQIPWSDVIGYPQGFGATFRGKRHQDNWFHFAIPSPALIPIYHPDTQHYDRDYGQRVRMEKVFVLYRNAVGVRDGALARIAQVDVWDGSETRYETRLLTPRIPREYAEPARTDEDPPDAEVLVHDYKRGQHDVEIQGDWNVWYIMSGGQQVMPPVKWGICISVLVHFAEESDILFTSAGVDFLLDVP